MRGGSSKTSFGAARAALAGVVLTACLLPACSDQAPAASGGPPGASQPSTAPAAVDDRSMHSTSGEGAAAASGSSEPALAGPGAAPGGHVQGESPADLPLQGGASSPGGSEATSGHRHIEIVGRQLLLDGEPLVLRGMCWNPVPVGATHPEGLDFAGFAAGDAQQLQELGVNVVRTYEPLLDIAVLDRLAAAGIHVIESVYPWGGAPADVVVERVRAVRNHPAILMWAVGNEWNYNGLYVGLSHAEALARLNEVVALIKAEDSEHPVATIYGELPDAQTLAAMPGIDVWGINAYRGISFGDLFESWRARSSAPMFISEYGADAYNANLPGYDPDSQALAVAALTREILANLASRDSGVSLGGTLFEWADEWWKDQMGSPSTQDVGGIAPGGGPYPDQVFNEEWWGVVDIQREPRPAFNALQAVYREVMSP